ncbi:ATP-binding protein [Streptomyces sp. NPDC002643]
MTAPSPPHSPGERPALRSLLPAPLLTALLGAGAVGGAVALAPEAVRPPLAGGAGAAVLLLTVIVGVAVHARLSAALLRQRLDAMSRDAGLLLQERARMAEEFGQERGRLTEEFVQERARIAAEFGRERVRMTAEFERERERLAEERTEAAEERARAAEETEREKARLLERARRAEADRTAALAVTANVAGRMQALATGTLADLRAMEERHADEDVLADLLHLDHRTAQAGRLADSVAVLAGARSGRRWARPIPMESILRGAMGRIGAYRRIRLHSSSGSAVAGHAAEGVMHALAELLDNAANFSPPTAEVHVYVEEVPAGVIVSVEDAGLVMSDVQLRRAERAVSGEAAAGITGLTGTRLGLAVVGRLAHKHGLKISFRPSARGGTGVLMLIPQDVLGSTAAPQSAPGTTGMAAAGGAPNAGSTTGTTGTTGAPGTTGAAGTTGMTVGAGSGIGGAADTTGAYSVDELYGPPRTTQDGGTGSSYANSLPPYDLTAEPTPTHESPAPDALPRRRRGQSLADAGGRGRADSSEFRIPTLRSGDDASSGAVRFSSFRRAVRGTSGHDQAYLQGTAAGEDQGATAAEGATGATAGTASGGELAKWEAEPVRGQEWEAEPASTGETEWEPGPVQRTTWDPEPVRGAEWELDPVRDLTWEPAREPAGTEPAEGTASGATPASASVSGPTASPASASDESGSYPSYPPYSSYASPSSYPSSSSYSSYAAYASYGGASADGFGGSPEGGAASGAGEDVGTHTRPGLDLPSNADLGLPPTTDLAPYAPSTPVPVPESNPYLDPETAPYDPDSNPEPDLDRQNRTHPHLEGGPTP